MGLAHACFEAHCIAMKRVITAIFDGILCCVRVGAKTGRREGDYRSSGGCGLFDGHRQQAQETDVSVKLVFEGG